MKFCPPGTCHQRDFISFAGSLGGGGGGGKVEMSVFLCAARTSMTPPGIRVSAVSSPVESGEGGGRGQELPTCFKVGSFVRYKEHPAFRESTIKIRDPSQDEPLIGMLVTM